jgi:hypothetical protein
MLNAHHRHRRPLRAQCFALMHNSDISGVGVVDPVSGLLVANLSVSDLRCLRSADDFDLLALPVIRFAHARWASQQRLAESGGEAGGEAVTQQQAQQEAQRRPEAAPPPTPGAPAEPQPSAALQEPPPSAAPSGLRPAVLTVTPEDTLLRVMEALVAHKLHRVYVAENAKPVGVVTITDVLRLFAVDPNDDPEGWLTW